MPYTNNVPQANQAINSTTVSIQTNFTLIQQLIDANHVDFSNSANMGKHNYVSFRVQSAAPATLNSEVAVYAATSSLTGNIELWFRPQNSGIPIQLTNSSSSASSAGWALLTGSLLFKWGTATALTTGNTVTYPVGANIPSFYLTTYFTQINPIGYTSNFVNLTGTSSTGFTIISSTAAGNVPIMYFAIGPVRNF